MSFLPAVITPLGSLALLALTLACGGDNEPAPAEPTLPPWPPTIGRPPGSTPTPQASIQQAAIPVRWVATDDIVLTGLPELPEPFAEARARLGGAVGTWGVYVVAGDSAPRQLHSSPRWITGIEWESNSTIRAAFATERRLVAPALGLSEALPWRGNFRIDVTAGPAREALDPLPDELSLDPGRGVLVQRDPASGRVLLAAVRGNLATLQPLELSHLFIVEKDGRARRLEGISGLRSISWVPNGKALVGIKGIGPPEEVFFLPASDGSAIVVASVQALASEGGHTADPDPKGYRVAFSLTDSSQRSLPTIVGVYDSNAGHVRAVATTNVFAQSGLIWPAGSNEVLIGNVEIIDINTGVRRPGSYADLLPAAPLLAADSPDGRYVASFAAPPAGAVTDACRGLPYSLTVEDKRAGSTRTLSECTGGTAGYLVWLNETKLIAGVAACWACESDFHNVLLIDVPAGIVRSLTGGLESDVVVAASPKGDRIVVAGRRLRMFGHDGSVLGDDGPPPAGFAFEAVAWSPDGASFAFLLRPAAWQRFGP